MNHVFCLGYAEGVPKNSATAPVPDPRETILSAAEACFERFGLAKTTMDDVAAAAQLSRATVYRYFSDRESLILAAVRRRAALNVDRVRAEVRSWSTFAGRLEEGIIRDTRRGRRDPIIRALIAGSDVALATRLLSATGLGYELTRELWEPVLRDAQAAGEMRHDIDLADLCSWISKLEIMFVSQPGDDDVVLDEARRMLRSFMVPAVVAG
jgi:AcrR family transcriptional regulator